MKHAIGMMLGAILYFRASDKVKFNWIDATLFIAGVTLLFV